MIIDDCTVHLERYGFAFLALERRQDGAFVGGAGLSWVTNQPFGAAVEIGWILDKRYWRCGYGREAGAAWLSQGWSLGLTEIVGFTSAINRPSRALMESLGMTCDPADDFRDPTVPAANPLAPHVLYRTSCGDEGRGTGSD